MVDIRMLQQVLQWGPEEVTGIEVFAKDIQLVSELNNFLYEEVLPSNLYSETIREKFPNIFEWLSLQDINKRIVIGLILLVVSSICLLIDTDSGAHTHDWFTQCFGNAELGSAQGFCPLWRKNSDSGNVVR
ncbi:MAG: hypothetical protein IPI30_06930 [Saprospiraceae bacterium]|nr:hypothetical protein [Candidatus Vicinibacter affinis]